MNAGVTISCDAKLAVRCSAERSSGLVFKGFFIYAKKPFASQRGLVTHWNGNGAAMSIKIQCKVEQFRLVRLRVMTFRFRRWVSASTFIPARRDRLRSHP